MSNNVRTKKIYHKPKIENMGSIVKKTHGQTAVAYDLNTPGNTYATISAIP